MSKISGAGIKGSRENRRRLGGISPSGSKKLVSDLMHFPPPINGIITLEPDTEYIIDGMVNLRDNKIFSSLSINAITGSVPSRDVIIYEGTGDFYTAVGSSTLFRSIGFSSTTGNFLNARFNGTALESLAVVEIVNCRLGAINLGLIEDIGLFSLIESSVIPDISGLGFKFLGSNNLDMFIRDLLNQDMSTGDKLLDLGTSVWQAIAINRSVFHVPIGKSCILGTTNNGNLTATGSGQIIGCQFFEGGNFIVNIVPEDIQWSICDNNVIEDSAVIGEMFFHANSTATVISAEDTLTKILGTTAASASIERFVHVSGRLTYKGKKPAKCQITSHIKTNASDINIREKLLRTFIFKNGVQVASSEGRGTNFQSPGFTDIGPNIISTATILLEEDDFIEIFIENTVDSNNITVTDLNCVITGL